MINTSLKVSLFWLFYTFISTKNEVGEIDGEVFIWREIFLETKSNDRSWIFEFFLRRRIYFLVRLCKKRNLNKESILSSILALIFVLYPVNTIKLPCIRISRINGRSCENSWKRKSMNPYQHFPFDGAGLPQMPVHGESRFLLTDPTSFNLSLGLAFLPLA